MKRIGKYIGAVFLAAALLAVSALPVFADGSAGEDVSVGLYLLTAQNAAPIAENLVTGH